MTAVSDEGIDYSEIENAHRLHFESPIQSVAILVGLPRVPEAKVEKLTSVLVKIVAEKARVKASKSALTMPLTEETTNGVGFLLLNSQDEAQAVQRALSNYALDKKHTIQVYLYQDIEAIEQFDEAEEPPRATEFAAPAYLGAWLQDERGRDMFCALQNHTLQVDWLGRKGNIQVAQSRDKWTDTGAMWSPRGSFLTTFHVRGLALWGGPDFDRFRRYFHVEPETAVYSKQESFLITVSNKPVTADQVRSDMSKFTIGDEGSTIVVWDVMLGEILRTFPAAQPSKVTPLAVAQAQQAAAASGVPVEPSVLPAPRDHAFKFSDDEKYVARLSGDAIYVYELPSMNLLDKKSIKADGVQDFAWGPATAADRDQFWLEKAGAASAPAPPQPAAHRSENVIAFWTPELQNQPARVTLMAIPSRTVIGSKNLFNVKDCRLYWQSSGDYLCVRVERYTKSKKILYTNLEIFKLRERGVPVQAIELKDLVVDFAWEPNGERFVVITNPDPAQLAAAAAATPLPGGAAGTSAAGIMASRPSLRPSVHFYHKDPKKGDFALVKTLENKQLNQIFFSPRGRHLVLAHIRGQQPSYDLEFYDLDIERDIASELESHPSSSAQAAPASHGPREIAKASEPFTSDIQWDPSGRYVVASSSIWVRDRPEGGFSLYDLRGQSLHRQAALPVFKMFAWRPRPPTFLTKDDQKRVRKNLRRHAQAFEEQDQLEDMNVSQEIIARRKALLHDWNAWRAHCKDILARLHVAEDESVETTVAEIVTEEILESHEEVVGYIED